MKKILLITLVLLSQVLFAAPKNEVNKQGKYQTTQEKRVAEYREFMKRQYNICLTQVSIYKKESEINFDAADLGKLYKSLALMRSEECKLMKRRINEFEYHMKHREEREETVPKMTFDNIYLFGKIKNFNA